MSTFPLARTLRVLVSFLRALTGGNRWLAGLAVLYTLANVPKPLTVDDAAYYYFARQFAADPARPYDFEMFWYDRPVDANRVLAPPVLPCWWSLALRLFGERPWLWKLWLLPFALLFVTSLHGLFRRFARGLEMPLTVLTVFSPAFLPSFNLMLDVPALALGLAALNLFLRACGRHNAPGRALLAGLLAGLAMQTKYTAFLVPVLMAAYALLTGRWRLGLIAGVAAAGLFWAWEGYVALTHGESHFWANLPAVESWPKRLLGKLYLASALPAFLGGLTPALLLLGLHALGVSGRWLASFGCFLALGYLVVATVDVPFDPELWERTRVVRPLEQGVFTLFAVLGTVVVLLALGALWFEGTRPGRLLSRFLVCWLLLETAGYFALSPFPAARRCFGLVIALTLLAGRLAALGTRQQPAAARARSRLIGQPRAPARVCGFHPRWRCGLPALFFTAPSIVGIVGFGVALGGLFWTVDLVDALTSKNAVAAAAERIARERSPSETVWYVGHWGFQFYAERAGMTPVVPAPGRGSSVLRPGDWLVAPDRRWNQQPVEIDRELTSPAGLVIVARTLPLRTVQCYYGGYSPLEHHSGPRMQVTLYRVTAAWEPVAE